MQIRRVALVVVLFVGIVVMGFSAPLNKYIGYSGYLTDALGDPVDGTQNLTFRIYSVASGGTAIWTETQSVILDMGEFSVNLGSVSALSVVDFSADTQYWLGIQIGMGTELSPRKLLLYVPYSFRSNSVIIEGRTSDPASPQTGQIWLRTDL